MPQDVEMPQGAAHGLSEQLKTSGRARSRCHPQVLLNHINNHSVVAIGGDSTIFRWGHRQRK
jgi:hypothetical protein